MTKTNQPFWRMVQHPNFALIVLIAVNLLIGVFTFQDFGPSWDEPLFYGYADALGYAYSIQPRLDGTFDIMNSYGPSSDHAMYGPAYLLLGRNFVYLFEKVTELERASLWHLVNFIFFQAGLIFFYLLCRRWLSNWAAFAATLMLATQPLLWGHAFINPKDIPFTVLFTVAVYTGLRFVDGLMGQPEALPEASETDNALWQIRRVRWMRAGAILAVLAVILLAFDGLLRDGIRAVMAAIYNADANSLFGRAFRAAAEDAGKVDVSYYAGVLIHYYKILRQALLVMMLPFIAIAAAWWLSPARSRQFWREAGASLRRIHFWQRGASFWQVIRSALLPGILLGLVTSTRVLGPLAGLLVALFFLLENRRRALGPVVVYAAIALLTAYLTWPYLWADPLGNFVQVLRHMSDNPVAVRVLFGGVEYKSLDLPATYLPTLLGITLTEPVWPMTLAGLVIAFPRMVQKKMAWRDFAVILAWFGLPFIYVILTRPPMYDGYRHFLFILPPVFISIGLFFQWILEWRRPSWVRWTLLVLAVLPGVLGIASMHPYEYAFYNSYTGGPAGAFRRYDSDYWLTCYQEAMESAYQQDSETTRIIVPLQASLARQSAAEGITVLQYERLEYESVPGDLFLLSSRFNLDQGEWSATEPVWTVGRGGAQYCILKRVP